MTVTAERPTTDVKAPSPSTVTALSRGRGAAVVASALAIGIAGGVLGCGLSTRITDVGMRDSEGYVTGVVTDVRSNGRAVVWDRDQLDNGTALLDLPEERYGALKIEASSSVGEVFIGVADSDAVADYLAGVPHARVVSVEGGRRPSYDAVRGGALPQPPTEVPIWDDAVAGPGRQTLVLPADEGDLSVVIMHPEGTAPIEAEVRAGTRLPWLDELALVLFVIGISLAGAGALGLWAALRPRR